MQLLVNIMFNQIKSKFSKNQIVTFLMALVIIIILVILGIIFYNQIFESLKLNFGNSKNYTNLFKGLGNTLLITIVAFLLGILLGLITCLVLGINSNNTFVIVLKNIFKAYVSIFRGTPMLVQLLIIYFIIFASSRIDSLYVAMLSFGLNSGAYVSEIIRGGINSVPVGQMEAGRSLGMSYSTVMKKIIFPQAFRNSLPSLGNELVTLVKETSIVGFVGAYDLTQAFKSIANATYDFTTVYLVMGVIYFVIVFVITKLLSLVERKLMKHANA